MNLLKPANHQLFLIVAALNCAACSLSAKIIVSCVGDSITFGAAIKDRGKNSYPSQLQELLGDDYKVNNFGVNGATLLKKGDKPYWKLEAYKKALGSNPDIVIIKLGTNDTKPHNWKHKKEYKADYKELISSFQKLDTKPRVLIAFPVPVAKDRWGINEKAVSSEVIPALREVSNETGCEIVDLYTALNDHHDLIPDGVHPNGKGASIIAVHVAKKISGKDSVQSINKN